MAGQSALSSFFRRFQRSRPEAAESVEAGLTPGPGGIPTPYPNTEKDEKAAAPDTSTDSFDEADATFGRRTDVSESKEVKETEPAGAESKPDIKLVDKTEPETEPDAVPLIASTTDLREGIVAPNNIVAAPTEHEGEEEEMLQPLIDASDGIREGIGEMNGVIAPSNIVESPTEHEGEEEEMLQPRIDTSDSLRDGIIGPNNIVGMNGIVAAPTEHEGDEEEMLQPLVDTSGGLREGVIAEADLKGLGMHDVVAPDEEEEMPAMRIADTSDGLKGLGMHEIVGMNGIVAAPTEGQEEEEEMLQPLVDTSGGLREGVIAEADLKGLGMHDVVAPDEEEEMPAMRIAETSDGLKGIGMHEIVGMNGIVAAPTEGQEEEEEMLQPLVDTSGGLREGIIIMNGVIGPNNIVESPTEGQEEEEDDMTPLIAGSDGSIDGQLVANAQFSLQATEFNLTDVVDDMDGLEEINEID